MKITRDDLFVQVSPGGPDLFEDWRWLIGSEAKPFLVSSVGDAFLQDSSGVNWLNVGNGTYTKVADSVADFQSMLTEPERLDEWFIPQLVGDILATGLARAPHECFGFKQPRFWAASTSQQILNPRTCRSISPLSGKSTSRSKTSHRERRFRK